MIDLSPEHLAEVKLILRTNVPGCQIRVFGSRITANAAKYSDLDLVICSDRIIEKSLIWKLEEAFSDSDLPFRVDVLDWQDISEQFRRKINEDYEIMEI